MGLVEDNIVIELVKKQIMNYEKENQSWIIEGFPRTKVQALALQKIGIIPDKFILLDVKRPTSVTKVKNNLIQAGTTHYGPALDEISAQAVDEYELHAKGVKAAFNGFIYEYNAADKAQNDVANDLARMLRIRYRSNAPRRPPRVILLGPPGSGRSTQAATVANRYGLVHLCTRTLLKQEIKRNPDIGKLISQCLDNGDMVPDTIVISLIEQRLKQSDCRVNGWILDGFPQTEA
jgi:adenylate kinase